MAVAVLQKGLTTMRETHKQALDNGLSEMTLDEINALIKECQQETKHTIATDDEVMSASRQLMIQNKEAYTVLAQ